MRFITSRMHGVLDYTVGLLMILVPRLLGFQTGGVEDKIFVILGVSTLAYSLLTRYEYGLFKVLPFRFHLTLDFLSGMLLAISPWLFGFSGHVWGPHFIFGVFEIGVALGTIPQAQLWDDLPLSR